MKEMTSRPISSTHQHAHRRARAALAAGLLLACLLLISPAAALADGSSSQGTKIVAALSGAGLGGLTPKGEAEFE